MWSVEMSTFPHPRSTTVLYEAFGWEVPVYVHCPLITDEEHQEAVTSAAAIPPYEDLLEQGFAAVRLLSTLWHCLAGARRKIREIMYA